MPQRSGHTWRTMCITCALEPQQPAHRARALVTDREGVSTGIWSVLLLLGFDDFRASKCIWDSLASTLCGTES